MGKTTGRTDTYHGRFVELVPGERVVEVMEFETEDPAIRGEMRVTYTLADAEGGGRRWWRCTRGCRRGCRRRITRRGGGRRWEG